MLNAVVEVAVGLIVVYSLLAVVSSAINEMLAATLATRAKFLRKGVVNLLGEKGADKLYAHPLISSLYIGDRLPSYLPPDKFALAVLHLTAPAAIEADTSGDTTAAAKPELANTVSRQLADIDDEELRDRLQVLWDNANHDVIDFCASLQDWFNNTVSRVQGWYRRRTQTALLLIGLVLAIALNVNTLGMASRLWNDGPLRSAVAEQAKKLPAPVQGAPASSIGDAGKNVQQGLQQVNGLKIPLGWGAGLRPTSLTGWLVALAGWVMTTVALSMGAPFWFDLLGKVASLRTSGSPEAQPAKPAQPAPAKPAAAPAPSG
jgi:hypothetical protein